jgi:hypothetical protein
MDPEATAYMCSRFVGQEKFCTPIRLLAIVATYVIDEREGLSVRSKEDEGMWLATEYGDELCRWIDFGNGQFMTFAQFDDFVRTHQQAVNDWTADWDSQGWYDASI